MFVLEVCLYCRIWLQEWEDVDVMEGCDSKEVVGRVRRLLGRQNWTTLATQVTLSCLVVGLVPPYHVPTGNWLVFPDVIRSSSRPRASICNVQQHQRHVLGSSSSRPSARSKIFLGEWPAEKGVRITDSLES